jgi:hypothetical protein
MSGGSGGVGATRTRACWPTNSSERPTARSVRIDGSPYHAVGKHDPRDGEREAREARECREKQPSAFEQRRDRDRCERSGDELQGRGPTGEHPAERERRRNGQTRDGREA